MSYEHRQQNQNFKYFIWYIVFIALTSNLIAVDCFPPSDVRLQKQNRTEIAPKSQTINPPVYALYSMTDRQTRHVIVQKNIRNLLPSGLEECCKN